MKPNGRKDGNKKEGAGQVWAIFVALFPGFEVSLLVGRRFFVREGGGKFGCVGFALALRREQRVFVFQQTRGSAHRGWFERREERREAICVCFGGREDTRREKLR